MKKWLINQYHLLAGAWYVMLMFLCKWLKMYDLLTFVGDRARKHIDSMY